MSAPLSVNRNEHGEFWLGTPEGLWRYNPDDGKPPAPFPTPDLPSGRIFEITSTADGAVWWRTADALVRYDGERSAVFTNLWRVKEFSDAASYPQRMAAAGDRLWVTGPGAGLVRFEGTNELRFTRQQGLRSEDTGSVAVAPDGTVWLADGDHSLARFDGTHFSYLTTRDGLPGGVITSIYAAPDGSIWLGTSEQIVARFDGQSFTCFGRSDNLSGNQSGYAGGVCWSIRTGPDGAVWFGTDDGLYRYAEKSFQQYTTRNGLPQGSMNALLATPGGGLVAGVGTNGIVSFDGKRFETVNDEMTVSDMVPGPDGNIWVAFTGNQNSQQSIALMRGGSMVSVLTNFSGLPSGQITCLARGPDGSLWAGGGGGGVIRFEGTNAVPTLVVTNGLLTNRVFTIHCTASGTVWIGTMGGIVRYDGTRWTEFTETNGAPGRWVSAIASGPDGSVWFGSRDGGLSRFDGKTMSPVAQTRELTVPSDVRKIFCDAQGVLWFATPTGVTRYDGVAWCPLDEGDGLLSGRGDRDHAGRHGRNVVRQRPGLDALPACPRDDTGANGRSTN